MVGAVVTEFLARAAAAVSIFILVRGPADGWKALASLAVAGCGVVLVQTSWMYWRIGFRHLHWQDTIGALRRGWNMFLFRGASNIYGAANAFILGLFVPRATGWLFRRRRENRQGASGVNAAVHPGVLSPYEPSSCSGCFKSITTRALDSSTCRRRGAYHRLGVGLLASRAVSLILGPQYGESVRVLYVFSLIIPLAAINNALIMHWMLPHRMERTVGAITLASIVINLISATVLAPLFAQMGMAWAVLIAEIFQLFVFVLVLFRQGLAGVSDISARPGLDSC